VRSNAPPLKPVTHVLPTYLPAPAIFKHAPARPPILCSGWRVVSESLCTSNPVLAPASAHHRRAHYCTVIRSDPAAIAGLTDGHLLPRYRYPLAATDAADQDNHDLSD